MDKFRLASQATILHLNARKGGGEEDKALAVDVKLQARVASTCFDHFDEHIRAALYTDIGAVRNPLMGPITFSADFSDYTMTIAGLTQTGVSLKKFSFAPVDGDLADLTLQASFAPSGTEVATLAEYLKDEISLTLEPSTEDLFEGKQ